MKTIHRVAFIDDRLDNRVAWHDTLQQVCGEAAELQTFATISDFRHQLDHGYTPDVVFVDFFLGNSYGTEIIDLLRSRFGRQVVIVAHSSMDDANAGMLQRGADAAIPKIKGMTPSPTLLERFPNSQAFAEFVEELGKRCVESGTQETRSPPASDGPYGDYQLLKLLGQGGMGSVWLARHQTLGRLVALKVLRQDHLYDDDAIARFSREVSALGRLPPHSHVVFATDARRIDGQLVLIMEYCDGLDLARVVRGGGATAGRRCL